MLRGIIGEWVGGAGGGEQAEAEVEGEGSSREGRWHGRGRGRVWAGTLLVCEQCTDTDTSSIVDRLKELIKYKGFQGESDSTFESFNFYNIALFYRPISGTYN